MCDIDDVVVQVQLLTPKPGDIIHVQTSGPIAHITASLERMLKQVYPEPVGVLLIVTRPGTDITTLDAQEVFGDAASRLIQEVRADRLVGGGPIA